jgi:hypothetical protein
MPTEARQNGVCVKSMPTALVWNLLETSVQTDKSCCIITEVNANGIWANCLHVFYEE